VLALDGKGIFGEMGKYLEHAIGSSQDPGTDWTTMLDSLTPEDRSLSFVPFRRGSIIAGRVS
jgi:hypothetical protein